MRPKTKINSTPTPPNKTRRLIEIFTMQTQNRTFVFAILTTVFVASSAMAHDGRRFDIQVINNKLWAQGYVSGDNPIDDGNGIVRSYYNAIHTHWATTPSGRSSFADLPGFDIREQAALDGDTVSLKLLGVKKWSDDVPFADFDHRGMMINSSTHMTSAHGVGGGHGSHHSGGGSVTPHFQPIGTGESILVSYNRSVLTIGSEVIIKGASDSTVHADLYFDFVPSDTASTTNLAPLDAIYVVQFELNTSDPFIGKSGPIHAIFSPAGDQVPGSHGLSLATEVALGAQVPEPTSLGLFAIGGLLLMRKRQA